MKKKSFDRREHLLAAALDEFIAYSYEEASLNRIIKNAGISKGTFYYHFQVKQALYLSLLQSAADAKIGFLEGALAKDLHNDDWNLFEILRHQARFGVEFAKSHPGYYLFGLMFLREKGNEIYKTGMDSLDDVPESYYDELLGRAMERGDFREGVSLRFIKKILPFILYRFDEIFDAKKEEIDFDILIRNFDTLIDFMEYGLAKERPEAQPEGSRWGTEK